MTGYGRGEVHEDGLEVVVEIRTLNHRFLDISLRVPKSLQVYEQDLKEMIRRWLTRGRVNITVLLKSADLPDTGLTVDLGLARTYVALLENLRQNLGIDGAVKLEHLLNFPEIFTYSETAELSETVWEAVQTAVEKALSDLKEMRLREGKEIEKDLRRRIEILQEKIQAIEQRSPIKVGEEMEKLRQRVRELVRGERVEESRLEMEIALLADRVDVTEECIRFRSHNTLFLEALEQPESAGRKLNFILQEMNREANTIGAKASDAEIAHLVVEIKEEVERLREQVQNIE
jgi:uncharacterized protein (TIGR00255 family)